MYTWWIPDCHVWFQDGIFLAVFEKATEYFSFVTWHHQMTWHNTHLVKSARLKMTEEKTKSSCGPKVQVMGWDCSKLHKYMWCTLWESNVAMENPPISVHFAIWIYGTKKAGFHGCSIFIHFHVWIPEGIHIMQSLKTTLETFGIWSIICSSLFLLSI